MVQPACGLEVSPQSGQAGAQLAVYITILLFPPFQGKPVEMPLVCSRLFELKEEQDEEDLLLAVAMLSNST